MTFNLTVTSRHERSATDLDRDTGEVTKTVEQRVYFAKEGTVAVPPSGRYAMLELVFEYRNGRPMSADVKLHLIRFVPEDVAALFLSIRPRLLAHRRQYRHLLRPLGGHLEDYHGWPDGVHLGNICCAPGEEFVFCDGVKFVPGTWFGPKIPTPEVEAAIRADAAARFGIVTGALTGAVLDPAVVAHRVALTPWVKDRNIGPYDPDYVPPADADAGWCDAAR